jgi:hypothetical protein
MNPQLADLAAGPERAGFGTEQGQLPHDPTPGLFR